MTKGGRRSKREKGEKKREERGGGKKEEGGGAQACLSLKQLSLRGHQFSLQVFLIYHFEADPMALRCFWKE
jgi:hypothetical protein